MKITKAQKEAVISLLKEKFSEKQQEVRNNFIRDHKDTIDNEINMFLKLQNELKDMTKRVEEIYKLTRNCKNKNTLEGEIIFPGFYLDFSAYQTKCYISNEITRESLLDRVYVKELETPNYSKIERELELATLSKDFNLDAFLAKYLPE